MSTDKNQETKIVVTAEELVATFSLIFTDDYLNKSGEWATMSVEPEIQIGQYEQYGNVTAHFDRK